MTDMEKHTAADRHKVIVGGADLIVDFGTTYTGVSYVHSLNPESENIEVIDSWPGKNGAVDNRTLEKVPTEISYNGLNPAEWGYQLAAGAPRYGCFKLMLDGSLPEIAAGRDSYGNSRQLADDLDSGNSAAVLGTPAFKSAVEVSTDYLKFVYEHTMSKLKQRMPRTLDATPIQFVLTTPAVWSHKAQGATLEAAEAAGFATRTGDTISMVSEPEAAATYCLQDIYAQSGRNIFEPGEKIVICDCGGGTVDLITYSVEKIKPVLKLREAVVGIGGKYGSTSIDRQFISMLKDRIGAKMFEKLGRRRTGRGGSIMQAFESAKRGFVYGDTSQEWYIPVGNVPDNETQQIEDGELLLEYDDMESLFHNSVTNIISLLRSQIVTAGSVSTILLVGGFGQSPYLLRRIQDWTVKTYPQMKITVERPRNAWSAITRGACLHGVGSVVKSRKLKQHYGILIGTPFIKGFHKEEDAWYSRWDGEKFARSNIDWYAAKGQSVNDGQQMTIGINTIRSLTEAKSTRITIYSCNAGYASNDKRNPSVYKLGEYVADFEGLPESAWEKKLTGNGILYRGSFETVMEVGSADIVFKVIYQGETCGSARMPYVSMGEGLRQVTK